MDEGRNGLSRFTLLALSNVLAVALILVGALYFFWQDDLDAPVVRVARAHTGLSAVNAGSSERLVSEPEEAAPVLTGVRKVVQPRKTASRVIAPPLVNAAAKQDAWPLAIASAPSVTVQPVAARAVTARRITPDASYDLAYATPGKPRLLDAEAGTDAETGLPVASAGKSDRADRQGRVRVASIAPEIPVIEPKPMIADEVDAKAKAELKKEQMLAKVKHKERERYCLSAAIYYESGYEPRAGKEAVAQVIMNRKAHKDYPNTICGVVFHNDHMRNRCQFSFACDGKPERPKKNQAWADSVTVAKAFLDDGLRSKKLSKATHYHADYVRPKWASSLNRVTKIGAHIFYSVPQYNKRRYASGRSYNKRSYRRNGRRIYKLKPKVPNLLASLFSGNR